MAPQKTKSAPSLRSTTKQFSYLQHITDFCHIPITITKDFLELPLYKKDKSYSIQRIM